MPRFVQSTVGEVLLERRGLQRVLLADGSRAYALTDLIGPLAVGDRVVVNTTAVDLGLGTGGWHVVHWNLSRDEWQSDGGGHVMKLRYTSEQLDTGVIEETGAIEESGVTTRRPDLGGVPVIACFLHSQLAPIALAARHVDPALRVVHVMTDSAALPIAISDLVHDLKERELIQSTVTTGQSFGGDIEAVNVASGMVAAVGVCEADIVVVTPGPGVVGTGTALGFGSLDTVDVLHAVATLRGLPFLALRWSDADYRERHRGLSHHASTVLEHLRVSVHVAVPDDIVSAPFDFGQHDQRRVSVPDMGALFEEVGMRPTSMGRTYLEDPGFYRFSAAAGIAAATVASVGAGAP